MPSQFLMSGVAFLLLSAWLVVPEVREELQHVSQKLHHG